MFAKKQKKRISKQLNQLFDRKINMHVSHVNVEKTKDITSRPTSCVCET